MKRPSYLARLIAPPSTVPAGVARLTPRRTLFGRAPLASAAEAAAHARATAPSAAASVPSPPPGLPSFFATPPTRLAAPLPDVPRSHPVPPAAVLPEPLSIAAQPRPASADTSAAEPDTAPTASRRSLTPNAPQTVPGYLAPETPTRRTALPDSVNPTPTPAATQPVRATHQPADAATTPTYHALPQTALPSAASQPARSASTSDPGRPAVEIGSIEVRLVAPAPSTRARRTAPASIARPPVPWGIHQL